MRVRYDLLFEEIVVMSDKKSIKHRMMTFVNDEFLGNLSINHADPDKELEHAKQLMEHAVELRVKHGLINSTTNSKPSTSKISELGETYLHVKEQRRKLSDKTLREYRAAYDTLIFILGDIEVGKLTPQNMNTFYDELRELPSGRNNSKLFKGKSFDEIKLITFPKDKKPTTSTVNKLMDRISTLLDFATTQQVIPSNPAKSVMREKDKVHSKQKREAFTDDELKKIFESPHFTKNEWRRGQGRREPYRFWLPLIALFTGARISEIYQLNKSDVIEEDGVWAFNITDEYDKKTGAMIKSVKNQNSIRRIPISQTLIDIGLLDYVSSIKAKKLFHELKSKKDGGDAAQKWVNNFLRRCGVHQSYTKTFHSLRHTFISKALNFGIEPRYVGGISGHLSKKDFGDVVEIANTYFDGYESTILKSEVIDKLSFDIDFTNTQW